MFAIVVIVVKLLLGFEPHAETVLPNFARLALDHELPRVWIGARLIFLHSRNSRAIRCPRRFPFGRRIVLKIGFVVTSHIRMLAYIPSFETTCTGLLFIAGRFRELDHGIARP